MLIGIDPGVSGAIGVLRDDGKFVDVIDIPSRTVPGSGRIRREIHAQQLYKIMEYIHQQHHDKQWRICIEKSFGGKAMFAQAVMSLGESLGIIRGIVEPIFGTEAIFYVAPARWKKAYRLGKDKNASLDLARSRFPEAPLNLKKHHNRSEALLLALWLRDFH